jgi:hypothetical protein
MENPNILHQETKPQTLNYDLKKEQKSRMTTSTIASIALITAGIAALTASVLETSSVFAFIGLGLLFWGIIFTYIRTEGYTRKSLLESTTTSQQKTTNQILKELGYNGRSIYLPPHYFRNPENQKVYITKHTQSPLPTPEEIQKQESQFFIGKGDGVLFTPSGAQLEILFERILDRTFLGVNLNYLEQNLPKVLTVNLEIARKIEIETEEDLFRVKITDPIITELIIDNTIDEHDVQIADSPLSSAIACALAKATDRLIVIEKKNASPEDKHIVIEYRLLQKAGDNP